MESDWVPVSPKSQLLSIQKTQLEKNEDLLPLFKTIYCYLVSFLKEHAIVCPDSESFTTFQNLEQDPRNIPNTMNTIGKLMEHLKALLRYVPTRGSGGLPNTRSIIAKIPFHIQNTIAEMAQDLRGRSIEWNLMTQKQFVCREGEDLNLWILCNVITIFTIINQFYSLLANCSNSRCPTIEIGSQIAPCWVGETNQDVSAPRYIYLHNEWVIEQFNNPDLFPSEQTASSPSFLSFFSLFFRREMIIMWHLNDKHLFDILNPSLFQRNSLIKLGGAKSSSSLMSHEESSGSKKVEREFLLSSTSFQEKSKDFFDSKSFSCKKLPLEKLSPSRRRICDNLVGDSPSRKPIVVTDHPHVADLFFLCQPFRLPPPPPLPPPPFFLLSSSPPSVNSTSITNQNLVNLQKGVSFQRERSSPLSNQISEKGASLLEVTSPSPHSPCILSLSLPPHSSPPPPPPPPPPFFFMEPSPSLSPSLSSSSPSTPRLRSHSPSPLPSVHPPPPPPRPRPTLSKNLTLRVGRPPSFTESIKQKWITKHTPRRTTFLPPSFPRAPTVVPPSPSPPRSSSPPPPLVSGSSLPTAHSFSRCPLVKRRKRTTSSVQRGLSPLSERRERKEPSSPSLFPSPSLPHSPSFSPSTPPLRTFSPLRPTVKSRPLRPSTPNPSLPSSQSLTLSSQKNLKQKQDTLREEEEKVESKSVSQISFGDFFTPKKAENTPPLSLRSLSSSKKDRTSPSPSLSRKERGSQRGSRIGARSPRSPRREKKGETEDKEKSPVLLPSPIISLKVGDDEKGEKDKGDKDRVTMVTSFSGSFPALKKRKNPKSAPQKTKKIASSADGLVPLPLPGEEVEFRGEVKSFVVCEKNKKKGKFDCLTDDSFLIFITNYRVSFIPDNSGKRTTIPLGLIKQIDFSGKMKIITLKEGTWFFFALSSSEDSDFLSSKQMSFPSTLEDTFAFKYASITRHLVVQEEERLGGEFERQLERRKSFTMGECNWRRADINLNYEVCETYPSVLYVPVDISDAVLRIASQFRTKRRLPVLTWLGREGQALCRSSQPTPGLGRSRSAADESLLDFIRKANNSANVLYLMDARPQLNAQANTIAGAGYEGVHYENVKLKFMGIDNIHVMRHAQQKLSAACTPPNQCKQEWYSVLEASTWMDHLSIILKGSLEIVDRLTIEKASVLVHCSDGWDRTSQLCSLAELMLDSHFRTLNGFLTLIEKDWIEFGHKFGDRCGQFYPQKKSEISPVWIQWLDCVYQLVRQFPHAFEFNPLVLVVLAEAAYNSVFGNFLGNSARERENANLKKNTHSLWAYISSSEKDFVNPIFDPSFKDVLRPKSHVRSLKLWEMWWLKWLDEPPEDQLLWRLCFENANLSREHKLTQEMSKIMEHEFDRANKKTRILDLELDKAMTRIQQLEEMLIALQGEKVDEDTKR